MFLKQAKRSRYVEFILQAIYIYKNNIWRIYVKQPSVNFAEEGDLNQ